MKNRHCGFTLLELLISTAILCILLALAGSCFAAVRAYCIAEETRAALYNGFFTAKTQALVTGTQIVVCPSSDGASCMQAAVWQHGWLIFQDLNQNREIEVSDRLLFRQPALSRGITLTSNQGRTAAGLSAQRKQRRHQCHVHCCATAEAPPKPKA